MGAGVGLVRRGSRRARASNAGISAGCPALTGAVFMGGTTAKDTKPQETLTVVVYIVLLLFGCCYTEIVNNPPTV